MVLGAAGTAAMLARASAPAAPRKLVSYADTEDIFEMTERELWGEDTGTDRAKNWMFSACCQGKQASSFVVACLASGSQCTV